MNIGKSDGVNSARASNIIPEYKNKVIHIKSFRVLEYSIKYLLFMEQINIEQIKNIKNYISEEDLNNVYVYLSMFFEEMDEEEKKMWINIIDIIDPENTK